MHPDIVQKFLVLAGELSYLEQASATHSLISEFLDICRHCDCKAQQVPLYAELEVARKFIAAFGSLSPSFADTVVENAPAYKEILVRPGISVDFLYHLAQTSALDTGGRLIWDRSSEALHYTN